MTVILILAAVCLICVTLFIIKQETPEDRTNDEKYKNASHTMRDTIREIRRNIKEIDNKIKIVGTNKNTEQRIDRAKTKQENGLDEKA
jgi:hypothetical protein